MMTLCYESSGLKWKIFYSLNNILLFRVTFDDWSQLRSPNEPTHFFSTSPFLAVFEMLTPFQSLNGNRIVMMNCNRIRDDDNHLLVKDYVWNLLNNPSSSVAGSSFHAVHVYLNVLIILNIVCRLLCIRRLFWSIGKLTHILFLSCTILVDGKFMCSIAWRAVMGTTLFSRYGHHLNNTFVVTITWFHITN